MTLCGWRVKAGIFHSIFIPYLIDITHTVGKLLETNRYVRCVMLDFSKAFDTVDHLIWLQKLQQYQLPNDILKWLLSCLSERQQTATIKA